MPQNFYKVVVRLHTFTLQRRVKTAGGLIYMIGAVISAIWQSQARMLGQVPGLTQVKTALAGLATTMTQLMQQAQSLFR